jgi:hypothetical protein
LVIVLFVWGVKIRPPPEPPPNAEERGIWGRWSVSWADAPAIDVGCSVVGVGNLESHDRSVSVEQENGSRSYLAKLKNLLKPIVLLKAESDICFWGAN